MKRSTTKTPKPLVQLVIPQLFAPLPLWQKDFAFQADSLLIASMCRYAHCEPFPQNTGELQHNRQNHQQNNQDKHQAEPVTFGLEQTLHHLLQAPVSRSDRANASQLSKHFAYYRYQADFGQPPTSAVLCADPVHLQTGIEQVILRPIAWEVICPKDARDLLQRLNEHFSQDGLHFVQSPKANGHWYVLFDKESDYYASVKQLRTTELSQVLGQNVLHHLPQAPSSTDQDNSDNPQRSAADVSLRWHRLLNEIQMLLHLPALSDSRDVAGDLPINSLWFWGTNQPYSTTVHDSNNTPNTLNPSLKISGVYGEHRLLPAFALMAESHPKSADDLITCLIKMKNLAQGQHILVQDALLLPAIHDQPALWRKALHQLEVNYLRPLYRAWQEKQIELQIYPCDGRVFQLKNKRFWQHFAKPKSNLQDFSR
ncbi:MAG: hypothetical protein ACWA5U_09750 [bacterium]